MQFALKEIFIAYEQGHLDEAANCDGARTTICLDFLLERECKKRSIPFVPLRSFVDVETDEEIWWKRSHDISREWYRMSSMDFFKYRNVRIAEAPEPIMQAYLAKLFYYVRIFIFLKKAHPGAHFVIPDPVSKNMSMECLMALQSWTVLDAARMVGLVGANGYVRKIPNIYKFERTTWKSWLLHTLNIFVGLVAPRHRRKIYLSGYWTHAESLVPHLDDTEIIVLETKKFREVPWSQVMAHRVRFLYSHRPVNGQEERLAREIGDGFVREWQEAKKEVAGYLHSIQPDLDWGPVLEACGHIVWYSPRVVADIDILYGIMKKEKPNLVLQMASVGGPHHYFLLMAHIARELGIKTAELQHATVTIDPRSVFCRIETDFLLTYGKSINEWHERIGNDKGKLIATGSPRFDRYTNEQEAGRNAGKIMIERLGLDVRRPILLVAVPFSETYVSTIDSYQLAEFLAMIRNIQRKTPGLQVLFKCRVSRLITVTAEYLKELFDKDFAVTGEEDIFPFVCASDAIICNNSTVIYQAAIAGKPIVLHPWRHFDSYHAQIYDPLIPIIYSKDEATNAVSGIFTDSDYREKLLGQQKQFLDGYLFDGKASKRVAECVKKICV